MFMFISTGFLILLCYCYEYFTRIFVRFALSSPAGVSEHDNVDVCIHCGYLYAGSAPGWQCLSNSSPCPTRTHFYIYIYNKQTNK